MVRSRSELGNRLSLEPLLGIPDYGVSHGRFKCHFDSSLGLETDRRKHGLYGPILRIDSSFEDFFDGKYPALFSGLPEARSLGMVILYVGLNFLGVAFIAVAISIYQRVNLVLHPADDLMQILRFRYFKGNAAKAMWASYIPPTIMAIVALVITRTFTNFGLGTIFAFLAQGGITGIADKVIFPKLKHQAVDVGQVKES